MISKINPDTLNVNLGAMFRAIRMSQDMSAREAADLTGLSNPYIIQIEAGKKGLSLKKFFQLCEGYDLDPVTMIKVLKAQEKLQ